MLFAAAYFCGAIRDKLQTPTPSPSPVNTQGAPDAVPPTVPPSETPNATRPNTISGGVLNAKARSLPQPEYPAAARAVRASGDVSVMVTVDKTGKVILAAAVSGHPLLRASAENAARKADFAPTMLAGQAVAVTGVLTYKFEP